MEDEGNSGSASAQASAQVPAQSPNPPPNLDASDLKTWSTVPDKTQRIGNSPKGRTKKVTHPMVQQFGAACYHANPPQGCSYEKQRNTAKKCTPENIAQGTCDFRKLRVPVGTQLEEFKAHWSKISRTKIIRDEVDRSFYNTYGPYFLLLPATQFILHMNRASSRWNAGKALQENDKTKKRGTALCLKANQHILAAAKILHENQTSPKFLLQIYRSPFAQINVPINRDGKNETLNLLIYLLHIDPQKSDSELLRMVDNLGNIITEYLAKKENTDAIKTLLKKASVHEMGTISKEVIPLQISRNAVTGEYEASPIAIQQQ